MCRRTRVTLHEGREAVKAPGFQVPTHTYSCEQGAQQHGGNDERGPFAVIGRTDIPGSDGHGRRAGGSVHCVCEPIP